MIPNNASIVRKAYEDFAKGDIPAVLEAFDPSITWHVPGRSPVSGDYNGRDEIVGALLFDAQPRHRDVHGPNPRTAR